MGLRIGAVGQMVKEVESGYERVDSRVSFDPSGVVPLT
jgi:hypothetical protein